MALCTVSTTRTILLAPLHMHLVPGLLCFGRHNMHAALFLRHNHPPTTGSPQFSLSLSLSLSLSHTHTHWTPPPGEAVRLSLDPSGTLAFCACSDGSLAVYSLPGASSSSVNTTTSGSTTRATQQRPGSAAPGVNR